MPRRPIPPGQRYGHWRVIAEVDAIGGDRRVICECDCGEVSDVYVKTLWDGSSTQCRGCRDRGMRK